MSGGGRCAPSADHWWRVRSPNRGYGAMVLGFPWSQLHLVELDAPPRNSCFLPGLWRKKIVRLQPPRQPNNEKRHASWIHHECFFIGLAVLLLWKMWFDFVSERWGRVSAQQQDFHWAILLRFYFDFEAGWKLNYANCQRCTPADLESKQTFPMILQKKLSKQKHLISLKQ